MLVNLLQNLYLDENVSTILMTMEGVTARIMTKEIERANRWSQISFSDNTWQFSN